MKIRYPDLLTVYTAAEDMTFAEKDNPHHDGVSPVELYWNDVHVELSQGDTLHISLTAQESEVTYLRLRFQFTETEKRADVRILGDDYERGYGTFRWEGIIPERIMPWYMLASNGNDRYSEKYLIQILSHFRMPPHCSERRTAPAPQQVCCHHSVH